MGEDGAKQVIRLDGIFLHFDKLFQIPIIIALQYSDVLFTEIMESFMFAKADRYPVVSSIMAFVEEARKIGEGGAEYVYSEEWLVFTGRLMAYS